jgi:GT2 family glycosyltransferase
MRATKFRTLGPELPVQAESRVESGNRSSTTSPPRTRVAAVLAAHNRRDLTLACLGSLRRQGAEGLVVDAYVLDDASSDGTGAAVAARFPEATVLQGDGQLYWNGGMRRALAAAMAGDYDHYLWMNDDTRLDDGALAVLLAAEAALRRRTGGPVIVAGSTRHPDTGELTYGGVVRPSRWRRLHWELVAPAAVPLPCETMNGNAVLVPRAVVDRVGNIDLRFSHAMGDYDYGLRARRAGCSVWVAPGTVGTCASHPRRRSDTQPLTSEWRRLWSTKELSPRSWAVFARRWAGRLWPLYWLSPYVRRAARLALERTQPWRHGGAA